MEKQHNRGQDGAGFASIKLDVKPGQRYISRIRSNDAQPIQDIFAQINGRINDELTLHPEYLDDVKLQKEKIIADLPNLDILFLANPNHFLDNLTKEDISQICEIGKQNNVIIVIDEVAGGFGIFRAKELVNKYDNLLVIIVFDEVFNIALQHES